MHIKENNPTDVEDMIELANATQSQKPNFYYAKHMQPGTCKYLKETVLVDVDAMQQMIGTGAGIPVFIHHKSKVEQSDIKDHAAGWITESFYNDLDGWAWFKLMAIDDEVRLAVANGWSVSNAYVPSQWGSGGTKNNVPYDREVVSANFTHLAIVPNPRYEDACIMTPEQFKAYQEARKLKLTELQNSNPEKKPSKGITMFKLIKQMLTNEEVTNAAEATHVEHEGKFIPVAEARELMNGKAKKNESEADDDAKKKAAAAEAEEKENESVDVDGEKMTMKDLKNSYRNMKKNEKKNSEEAEKKKAEDEKENAAKAKKNADEAEAKKKEEDEKTNGKGYFEQLVNAREVAPDTVTVVDTGASMAARGQARYGSEALKK